MSDIAIRGVRKSYGRIETVHGLDLAFGAGEFVVILGPSGCGKSTLLRMIAGLESITAGEIAIGGRVVNRLEPRERGCAMVFQNYALYPHMTVAENIGYALKVAGVPKAERLRRIAEVGRSIGLDGLLDRRPAQLSGGQRQRVAMGRAIIREPKVFLFDEPLSNLDATLRVQMRIEIRRLHDRQGVTSVFVTHDQTEAMTLADRLVVLNAGRVEQVGTPEEVYHRPASRFVAGFVGSPPMNVVDATAAGPDTVTFGGLQLTVPPHGLERGARLAVGFRPEDAVPTAQAAPDGPVAAIDLVEDLGALRLLRGRLGGADVVVQTAAGTRHGRGPLPLQIAPSAIHLFDAETGLRLAPRAVRAAAA
ncbi:ABC transporter ATP-binding protein [Lichenibacterium ramalinae]|uniref:sn-glycerol-3-phosphate ABC transporter ATP-binding protein UgpC n=1 Tax=Lichenibacterium ramalinae TaxID=2316527 RepID=A0A4V1RII4_9HYPH|nr:sn-glycerol-3-phosphate ABC transporter ATP-binding protein UgpC [Lichenibacterium ramalinae]RYB04015.1 sn-glycerol-3-phosphate ABC transporter ATP-binding protein UgpC [Lichenibacterium ramalinae]